MDLERYLGPSPQTDGAMHLGALVKVFGYLI
jgi:hypothetical protein